MYQLIERYLFAPKGLAYIVAFVLLPLSMLYCLVVYVRYKSMKAMDMGMPIIGVGNLIVGGSGKTPFIIEVAKHLNDVAVVLRGYKRISKGMHIVSKRGTIVSDVALSGDEAQLIAQSVPHATVIVANNRLEAIRKAKALGAKVVLLDDAFSKHNIQKLDIILDEANRNYLPFCLPSGPYREKLWWGKKAMRLEENRDFKRVVHITNATQRMTLVTAIAKPWRLDAYLPKGVIEKFYFIDHHSFTSQELKDIVKKTQASSILVTQKDAVKLNDFDINLSVIELTLDIDSSIMKKIDTYVRSYNAA